MSSKPKKFVVTPEEVANTPTRQKSARSQPQQQVLELEPLSNETTGVITYIPVNDVGEVSIIDGQEFAIQITGDSEEPSDQGHSAVLDGPITLTAASSGEELAIQPPHGLDAYRRGLLDGIQANLTQRSEKYSDLAIFCNDGVVWSSKLILASASPFMKDLLLDVPNMDDTCLVLPSMTRLEFMTFQSAMFSKDDTPQTTELSELHSVIKGSHEKSDNQCFRNSMYI